MQNFFSQFFDLIRTSFQVMLCIDMFIAVLTQSINFFNSPTFNKKYKKNWNTLEIVVEDVERTNWILIFECNLDQN